MGDPACPQDEDGGRLAEDVRFLTSERDALRFQLAVVSRAMRELTSLRSADSVVTSAVRLAAELISPSAGDGRRALYFVIDGDEAHVVAEFDETGRQAQSPFLLTDHPALAEVVALGLPRQTQFEEVIGAARTAVDATRITHGAAVPVRVEGDLHGVLAVGSRGKPIAEFERLVDLAGVVELALANARATEELARQATTDSLTGVANRRGLEQAATLLIGSNPYTVVAADLDGFKRTNDTLGHDAGDAALREFAEMLLAHGREGDVIARVGGDEFLVLLSDTDITGGEHYAARVLTLLREEGRLAASIGVAAGIGLANFRAVCARADNGMYEAKRSGGMTYVTTHWAPPLFQ